ncbi:MAG: hypothetical protein JST00_07050 [Deltaproteobacteria bacterium]|nr:hypothetical protein [Deltaproteobacteria bacterium]
MVVELHCDVASLVELAAETGLLEDIHQGVRDGAFEPVVVDGASRTHSGLLTGSDCEDHADPGFPDLGPWPTNAMRAARKIVGDAGGATQKPRDR